jgi:hypothetical protein
MKSVAIGLGLLSLAVGACGSTTSPSPSPTALSSTSASAAPSSSPVNPNAVTFTVKVTGSKAEPSELTTVKGKEVTLSITTDKDEEVHLHGYDLVFDCKAGTPQSQTFVADKTGNFEFELEASATHLGNLIVNPG